MAIPAGVWLAGMLAPSLLQLLFGGGGDEQTQTTETTTDNPRYRSPALGFMEPGALSAILGNMQAMGGAGMPGGISRFGGNADTMFSDILAMLKEAWPTVKSEYTKGDEASCRKKCEMEAAQSGGSQKVYSECLRRCQFSAQK